MVCFNISNISFNVFPSKDAVEAYIKTQKKYKTMAMSIFASGGGDIKSSINYIKELEVDYVVFGSSKIDNIKNNFNLFKSD